MDLLKEKYSSLLKENKEDYPYIKGDNNLSIVSSNMTKLPKFLKHLHVDLVIISMCPKLKSLENCPITKNLWLYDSYSLRTLKGVPNVDLGEVDIGRDIPLKSFEGMPTTIHHLSLHSVNHINLLRKSIESGEYKPKKIGKIHFIYYTKKEHDRIKDDVKYFRDVIGVNWDVRQDFLVD